MINFKELSLANYNRELEDFGFHDVTEENIQAIIQMFDKYKNDSKFVEFMEYSYKDEENEYDDTIASLFCGPLSNQEDVHFFNDRLALFSFTDYSPEQCWIVQNNRGKQWYMVVR